MSANYITINSKFQPFSLGEMSAPYIEYGKLYNTSQSTFSDTANNAEVIGSRLDPDKDKGSYSVYKNYANDLQSKADDLMKYGYNGNTARNLFNMKKRYATEIVDIGSAITKKEQQEQAERTLYMNDPTVIIDRPAATRSVDDYLQGADPESHVLSRDKVIAAVGANFKERAAKIWRDGRYRGVLGGQYFEKKDQTGWTPTEINTVIESGGTKGDPELVRAYNEELNKYMSSGNWSDSQRKQITDAVNIGVRYGIGTISTNLVSDKSYDYKMKAAMDNAASLDKIPEAKPRTMVLTSSFGSNAKDYAKAYNSVFWHNGKFKQEYFGLKGQNNPMKVYEDRKKLSDSEFKSIYGNTKVIDKDTYKSLGKMGFSSTSATSDFISNAKNMVAKEGRAVVLNSLNTDISGISTSIANNINSLMSQSRGATSDIVRELDEHLNPYNRKMKPGRDAIDPKDIYDISYSMDPVFRKDFIISLKGGKRIAVNIARLFDQNTANRVEQQYFNADNDGLHYNIEDPNYNSSHAQKVQRDIMNVLHESVDYGGNTHQSDSKEYKTTDYTEALQRQLSGE